MVRNSNDRVRKWVRNCRFEGSLCPCYGAAHRRVVPDARPTVSRFSGTVAMVPRYSRPAMTAIWSAETRYRIWFEIEAYATDALADLGVVPKEAAGALWRWWATDPAIDVEAIDAIEAGTKHDVIAFLTWAGQKLGPERRWLHQGMTSSDVLDTALAVPLKPAAALLLADLDKLLAA